MDRLFRAAGGCALAFLLVLGCVALLPPSVQAAVPDSVIGGIAMVCGALGARRMARRSR
ncbi:hypothetical protein ACWGCI_28515 [Streptomyces sp. NPDC054949]|uniref:hypothetical protein n=1 Tax=unclassified Streptomyces TaxID=2593676 RepID=UPI000A576765|nr:MULTISPECIES: hypothetical protein [unclassified Streptomyces]MCX5075217.1 hypothetical protein [Streptomyces sp. NBC_00424]MCX5153166.1 hypothetical protein [Streptomyces sp. NBC_00291]WUD41651.1 hypothetical protein OHA84_14660 [Streptomyces sp. NBC_00513]